MLDGNFVQIKVILIQGKQTKYIHTITSIWTIPVKKEIWWQCGKVLAKRNYTELVRVWNNIWFDFWWQHQLCTSLPNEYIEFQKQQHLKRNIYRLLLTTNFNWFARIKACIYVPCCGCRRLCVALLLRSTVWNGDETKRAIKQNLKNNREFCGNVMINHV